VPLFSNFKDISFLKQWLKLWLTAIRPLCNCCAIPSWHREVAEWSNCSRIAVVTTALGNSFINAAHGQYFQPISIPSWLLSSPSPPHLHPLCLHLYAKLPSLHSIAYFYASSVLTQSVGWQKWHPACKTEYWCWLQFDWSFACPKSSRCHLHCLLLQQIQDNFNILVWCLGNWLVKRACVCVCGGAQTFAWYINDIMWMTMVFLLSQDTEHE